jgi:hypothetical protein
MSEQIFFCMHGALNEPYPDREKSETHLDTELFNGLLGFHQHNKIEKKPPIFQADELPALRRSLMKYHACSNNQHPPEQIAAFFNVLAFAAIKKRPVYWIPLQS